ncbi:MAG: DUF971 domain-containing protein [Chloroflexota bacterium]
MSDPIPQGMTADRKKSTLTIVWDEEKECVYPFDLLRNACPCAQCRGGHENMTSEPEEDVFTIPLMNVRTLELVNIEAVGNYAINIEWGDGHKYGIYNWAYLYSLCEKMEN